MSKLHFFLGSKQLTPYLCAMKKKKDSQYKHVTLVTQPTGSPKWRARPNSKEWGSLHETEREAALCVDRWLIRNGKSPVNILKPVQ